MKIKNLRRISCEKIRIRNIVHAISQELKTVFFSLFLSKLPLKNYTHAHTHTHARRKKRKKHEYKKKTGSLEILPHLRTARNLEVTEQIEEIQNAIDYHVATLKSLAQQGVNSPSVTIKNLHYQTNKTAKSGYS